MAVLAISVVRLPRFVIRNCQDRPTTAPNTLSISLLSEVMRSLIAVTVLLGAAVASPYEVSDYIRAAKTTLNNPSAGTSNPCGSVSNLVANATDVSLVKIPADLALQCLRSVPLAKSHAEQLLGLSTFVQFQTTLAYLKDPPPG